MLKRVFMIIALSLLLPAMIPAAAHAADTPTIAIIDYEKILSDSKAGVSLQKQIQAKREAFSKEFAEKDKSLKTAQADIIEAKEKLSAEEFNKKRKAFDAQVGDVKSLFEKRSNSLRQGVDKSMAELRKKILEAAAKVAEEKGFDLVLTRDAVVIADKDMDITADVLKALDASTPSVSLKVE